jgi:hypothetical protein
VIITNITEHAQVGQPFFRFLMSDLHLGSVNSDHDEIIHDLDRAKTVGARVLINGDVFDAIGPKDRRFDLTVLHPSVQRKKDLAAAIVDMAFELLAPYASIIDIIGIGNHEESWVAYCNNDPVRQLIDRLNGAGGRIKHGSFWGYIRTSFRIDGYRNRPRHKLLYLHGTGGDSPVTKGTIDFNRKGRNWVYDALTFGHKHNLVCSADQMADVSDRGRYAEKRQLNLQTGSYYRNYRELDDDTVLDQSYAARSAHPPKPMGGIFLIMRPDIDRKTGELRVAQDFATDIVRPWTRRQLRAAS